MLFRVIKNNTVLLSYCVIREIPDPLGFNTNPWSVTLNSLWNVQVSRPSGVWNSLFSRNFSKTCFNTPVCAAVKLCMNSIGMALPSVWLDRFTWKVVAVNYFLHKSYFSSSVTDLNQVSSTKRTVPQISISQSLQFHFNGDRYHIILKKLNFANIKHKTEKWIRA